MIIPKDLSNLLETLNDVFRCILEVCKSNRMLILNGRCGDDKYNGSMSFRNQSVIDYSIV